MPLPKACHWNRVLARHSRQHGSSRCSCRGIGRKKKRSRRSRAGAVGTCAVQLAHLAGARVIITCRSDIERATSPTSRPTFCENLVWCHQLQNTADSRTRRILLRTGGPPARLGRAGGLRAYFARQRTPSTALTALSKPSCALAPCFVVSSCSRPIPSWRGPCSCPRHAVALSDSCG